MIFKISLEHQIRKELFRKEIRLTGVEKYIKLQKLLLIQCRVLELVLYGSVIKKPCW